MLQRMTWIKIVKTTTIKAVVTKISAASTTSLVIQSKQMESDTFSASWPMSTYWPSLPCIFYQVTILTISTILVSHTCWPSWQERNQLLRAAPRRPWWTAPAGWSALDGTWRMRTCDWSRKLFSLVGHEGEDVNSNEADEKAEDDGPQDEPNIPPGWADLLTRTGTHWLQLVWKSESGTCTASRTAIPR